MGRKKVSDAALRAARQEIARRGGQAGGPARAKRLSGARRREIARMGAAATNAIRRAKKKARQKKEGS